MNLLKRSLMIVAVVVLGVGEGACTARARLVPAMEAQTPLLQPATQAPDTQTLSHHTFTGEQRNAFISAMTKAEAISDPLQRCLAYPDPPDSHWSRDTVVAYCHYRQPPLLSFAQMQALIQGGKSAELDHRLAKILQAQQADPASGQFDRIYEEAFRSGTLDIRPTLDAWKRSSPDSAFAAAASGLYDVSMARAARGGKLIKDTPDDAVHSMDNLLQQADGDLRRAIHLNPKLSPAYAGLMNAGAMSFGERYVAEAFDAALIAVPDDFEIYNMAMWSRQPNWGGSVEAMDQLAAVAQQHAKTNPMLRIMQTSRPFYQVWNCDCTHEAEMAAYPQAADELVLSTDLIRLGNLATDYRDQTMSLIYESEALRFTPDDEQVRVNRAYALMTYDNAAWAAADMTRLLTRAPKNGYVLNARARAYEYLEDYANSEKDLRTIIALYPANSRALAELGRMLVNSAHEWDKGWVVANALIHDQPKSAYGWILRASIQENQPRAGLDVTADYLQAHFGSDPQMANMLVRMRGEIGLRKSSGIDKRAMAH